MRVYKISTNLTNEENKELVRNISEEDSLFLATLDIKVSVDLLDDEDKLTTVMVTNIINLEKLKSYFIKMKIYFDIEDITEEFSKETEEKKLNEFLEELTTEDILKTFGVETN
jgi:hypothetical protein